MKAHTTDKPLLLDLFSGAGGAAMGYWQAGFVCVGVDLVDQRRYPFEFHQDDALCVLDRLLAGEAWHGYHLWDFDMIHASPPCQEYSVSRHIRNAVASTPNIRPKLLDDVYARLRISGVPWVIENVPGAPMPDSIKLCGSMFGLGVRRHRQFASSHLLFAAGPCAHTANFVELAGGKVRGCGSRRAPVAFVTPGGYKQRREGVCTKADGQRAMGIEWMTIREMCEAIPPAYTRWIGQQLMGVVRQAA